VAVSRRVDWDSSVDGHPLPCGRSVEDVFDDLDAGRTSEHSRAGEHCATARRSVENLMEATAALVADPSEPSPNLLDRIMQAVRAEARRGEVLSLDEAGRSNGPCPTDISEAAVAAVLRFAADSVDGVWARSCHITDEPEHAATVGVAMSLTLRYGTGPVDGLLGEVRGRLAAALAGQVGLHAHRVDLQIVDVWPEES